jgi:hypothetical protein
MSEAVGVYTFVLMQGESIQLWIHGYDQHTFVGFDLKPGFEQPVLSGQKLFLAYHVVGVGEHVDITVGYTLVFTNQSEGEEFLYVSGFLINLFEPIARL